MTDSRQKQVGHVLRSPFTWLAEQGRDPGVRTNLTSTIIVGLAALAGVVVGIGGWLMGVLDKDAQLSMEVAKQHYTERQALLERTADEIPRSLALMNKHADLLIWLNRNFTTDDTKRLAKVRPDGLTYAKAGELRLDLLDKLALQPNYIKSTQMVELRFGREPRKLDSHEAWLRERAINAAAKELAEWDRNQGATPNDLQAKAAAIASMRERNEGELIKRLERLMTSPGEETTGPEAMKLVARWRNEPGCVASECAVVLRGAIDLLTEVEGKWNDPRRDMLERVRAQRRVLCGLFRSRYCMHACTDRCQLLPAAAPKVSASLASTSTEEMLHSWFKQADGIMLSSMGAVPCNRGDDSGALARLSELEDLVPYLPGEAIMSDSSRESQWKQVPEESRVKVREQCADYADQVRELARIHADIAYVLMLDAMSRDLVLQREALNSQDVGDYVPVLDWANDGRRWVQILKWSALVLFAGLAAFGLAMYFAWLVDKLADRRRDRKEREAEERQRSSVVTESTVSHAEYQELRRGVAGQDPAVIQEVKFNGTTQQSIVGPW